MFSDDDVEKLARLEHDRWMAERTKDGWIYGPVRDNQTKMHPDLVPFDQLSPAAREKDREAVSNIPKVMAEAGFTIVRRPA